MRIVIAALLASVVAVTTVGSQPTEAAKVDGWNMWTSRASSFTQTYTDGSPRRSVVALDLQKKPGTPRCRAVVTVTRSRFTVSSFKPLYKYVTNYTRRKYLTTYWVGSSTQPAKVTVNVRTNGNCIYRVWAR
jgi:hypothetical protein